jgi:hypothetical protein
MKLILEMSEEVMNNIVHLVKITKSKNKADVIGKALSVYNYLVDNIGLGKELLLRSETKIDISFVEK